MPRPRPSRSHSLALRSGAVTLLLPFLIPFGLEAQTTFTVNTTDDLDDGVCNAAHCSLREALNAANLHAEGATVAFNIPGPPPHTIRPTSGLPPLMGKVVLDGTTEPDFAGSPVIELDGTNAGGFTQGVPVEGDGNTIRGLVVNRFSDNGISMGGDGNVVEGCYVGTDVTGTVDLGNGNAGVLIGGGRDNRVGGTTTAARNVISGNPEGVTIVAETATGNVVEGNYIGTDATGTVALPNHVGVLVLGPGNTIGGTTPGARNVVSGNNVNGVDLGPPHANGNLVAGNYVGVDASGTLALGNGVGIFVNNVTGNTIGGTSAAARNVVSGNVEGITLWDIGSTGNLVRGNYVGTNPAGSGAIPNRDGIVVYGPKNTIGGTQAGAGNLVSGNTSNGIMLAGPLANENLVQGNRVGTDAAGSAALGNAEAGASVGPGSDNVIGGTESGARNLLSGNKYGVLMWSPEADGNVVQGNYIGTNAAGTAAIPNQSGVLLWSSNTIVGGSSASARNLISGNAFAGIDMGEGTNGTIIRGNYIGTDVTGSLALRNDLGIFVNFAPSNTIGGTESGQGNLISGNGAAITINGAAATGNLVQGNIIGPNAAGTAGLGSTISHILVIEGATGNTIGGTASGAGNVIAYAAHAGVQLTLQAGTGNRIQGNAIFENGLLGIDLGADGVTANDAGDPDSGPNGLQNYPVLSAVAGSGGAVVRSTLNSAPSATYTLEFFASPACDASGYGEGRTLLGSGTLTTDATGNGSVVTNFAGASGPVFTATATDASLSTSEFSRCASLASLGVTGSPTTSTVKRGKVASYSISVSAQGGTLDEAVSLACSGAPAASTCSFATGQVTPGSSQASTVMQVTTARSGVTGPLAPGGGPAVPVVLWLAGVALLGGLVLRERLRLAGPVPRARDRRSLLWPMAKAGLAVMALLLPASCGDDGTGPGGTPRGTYQLTVTATWQSVQASTTVTLVVQ